ncbi:trafficking protein particle complex II-specific subunit 130 [[Candida] jaroonii]|uniref:Trafficking protein particle complex II-specific subunit 130 n=1 Tax=[Candida] jaroonii TaxID=467808 RepID=A0ACA9YAC0_9ASCO|nr:trafficking protein particle complex II-specific subunit 130 [[Candida] jaroonii]
MIQIGYYDPFNVYPLIQPNIESKLPLTNLHWKFQSTLKSIPKLPVKFIEENPRKVQNVDGNIMFITFKELETYKSQVRPLIKEWLKIVGEEWLIVVYNPKKDKLFKMSTFEKLRTDFGKDGKELLKHKSDDKERVFRLKETNDNDLEKLELYNDFINHLKDIILSSYSGKFQKIQSQLKDSEFKDLVHVKLILSQQKLYENLGLVKDSLMVMNEASKIMNEFTKTNKFDMSLSVRSEDIPFLLINSDILVENNLFRLKWGMFSMKAKLMLSMVDDEPLNSMKVKILAQLFQDLIVTLNDLSIIYKNDISEFNYLVSGKFIKLPDIGDLVESGIDMGELNEIKGELKLFQRSMITKLGASKGFSAGLNDFHEINLEDKEEKEFGNTISKINSTILSNEDAFYTYFESITESAISDFLDCNRTKTIDILSIDLAIINYKRQNYQKCLEILNNAYEFLIDNGWTYMGGVLLTIYIECLEKTNSNTTKSYIKLLSNLSKSHDKIDINKFTTSTDIFSKLSDEQMEVSLEEIFKVEVDHYIHYDNGYYIVLNLQNIFNDTILDLIDLKLSEELHFTAKDVQIKKNNEIRLYTQYFSEGFFKPLSLVIRKGNIRFTKDFKKSDSLINQNKDNSIYYYPIPGSPMVDLEFCSEYLLGSPQLSFKFKDVKSRDVRLNILQYEGFTFDESLLSSITGDFEVPIKITTPKIHIKVEMMFEDFTYLIDKSIDTNLMISVSVQDIFRTESIFSRYQISSLSTPIRIKGIKLLNDNDNYTVKRPKFLPTDVIITGEQTFSSFYEIVIQDDYKLKPNDEFRLEIDYSSLNDEMLEILEASLNLGDKLYLFRNLIAPKILFDFKRYIIRGDVKFHNVDEIQHILHGINKFLLQPIEIGSHSINTEDKIVPTKEPKRLLIDVPIPSIDILQIIEFKYPQKVKYIVGEPIEFEIFVEFSQRWAHSEDEDISILAESSVINENENFQLLLINDDNWLISGHKKKNFKMDVKNPTVNSFKVVLIPLNVGRILLPKVNIKLDNKDISMDLLVKNGSESLLVVPELDTITFTF